MKIVKIIIAVLLVLIIWLGYLGYAVMSLKPKITAEWGYVDDKTTELGLHIYLGKKLPISINVKDVTIEWAGVKIGKIENMRLGFMQDRIDGVLVLDNYKAIEALKNHIKNGEKSYAKISVQASIFGISVFKKEFTQEVETDILSYFDIKTESSGDLIKSPAVEGISSRWGPITDDYITVYSDVKLYNPNSFPIPVSGVQFNVNINENQVASGELIENTVIPANGYGVIKVKTLIDTAVLPKVWAEHIKRGEESDLSIVIYLKVNILNKELKIKVADVHEKIKTDIIDQINSMLQG
ncbi:MAG: LEA type 2 family protein [Thermococcus sp.]|uniref:LEA type 2 family protein n=1 Tax=Thermococcus sp. TaxID=35749 RepID=UPI001DCE9FF2|nr:LEA type 2 family protein [Thermococcus sp.]MBO8173962.1 LEA type 2 family protein [Thermococcus sp.]